MDQRFYIRLRIGNRSFDQRSDIVNTGAAGFHRRCYAVRQADTVRAAAQHISAVAVQVIINKAGRYITTLGIDFDVAGRSCPVICGLSDPAPADINVPKLLLSRFGIDDSSAFYDQIIEHIAAPILSVVLADQQ